MTFHRTAWLLVNRAWWWRGVEEGREVRRGRREVFFGHRCHNRREVMDMDAEVALYFAEQDVFDDEDLDPLSDEWEAAEFEANAGDR